MGARAFIIIIIVITSATSSTAGMSLAQGINTAQEQLEAGEVERALEIFQELRVDYPQAQEPRFGIGCAWFMKGEQHIAGGAPEEAAAAFSEARSVFETLMNDENTKIAREASFNRANTLARAAMLIDPAMDFDSAVAALRASVKAYEKGLEQYPDHADMRQNLEHMRYQLKQLLQQTPEQQEEQEQQPPDQQPPPVYSLFGRVDTQLPGARALHEDNTAILVLPEKRNSQP